MSINQAHLNLYPIITYAFGFTLTKLRTMWVLFKFVPYISSVPQRGQGEGKKAEGQSPFRLRSRV